MCSRAAEPIPSWVTVVRALPGSALPGKVGTERGYSDTGLCGDNAWSADSVELIWALALAPELVCELCRPRVPCLVAGPQHCIPVVWPPWPGPSRPLSTERELGPSWEQGAAAGSLTASESRHQETPLPVPGNPGTAPQPRTSSTGQLLSDRNNNIGICRAWLRCPALASLTPTPRDGRNPSRVNKKQNNKAGLMRVFCRCFLPWPGRVFLCLPSAMRLRYWHYRVIIWVTAKQSRGLKWW